MDLDHWINRLEQHLNAHDPQYAEIHEPISDDRLTSVALGRRETFSKTKVDTRVQESSMAVFLTIEVPASDALIFPGRGGDDD